MNIAICTVASYKTPLRPEENFIDATNALKQLYCERHGLRYIFSDDNPRPEISAQWAKFSMILHAFRDHKADWAIWMDADAAPVNLDFDVAKFLGRMPMDKVIMRKDILGWNSGVFAVPNCPRAIEWLTMLDTDETVKRFDPYPDKYPFKDQDAIVASFEEGYGDFVIQPADVIGWNQYDKIYGRYSNGMPNEFIEGKHWCLHIPGFYNGHRKKRFEYFINKIQSVRCPIWGRNAYPYMTRHGEIPDKDDTHNHGILRCSHCGFLFDDERNDNSVWDAWVEVTSKAKDAFEKAEEKAIGCNLSFMSTTLAAHQPALLVFGLGKGVFAEKLRQLGLSVDYEQVVHPFLSVREKDDRNYSMIFGDDVVQTTFSDATLFENANKRLLNGGMFIVRNMLSDVSYECKTKLPLDWPMLNPDEWRVRLHSSKSIELLAASKGFAYIDSVGNGHYQVFVKTRELD